MDTFYHEILATDQNHPIQLLVHQGTVNFVVLEHWHRALEMSYFLESDLLQGCGASCWVNGKKIFIGPGNLVLFNSGDIHALEPTHAIQNQDGQVLGATLFLSYDFLKELCPDFDNIVFALEGCPEQIARLKELFLELIELYSGEQGDYFHLQIASVALQISYILLTYFAQKKNENMIRSQKYLDRLAKIMDYMKENYKKPLTLHEISEQFCVSEQYLSKVFKTYTGHTFKQYLNQIRLEKAYRDVIRSEYSMTEIAMRRGFSDMRSFISVFKNAYGVPPMQYRKECANRVGLENPPIEDTKPFVRPLDK